jgi:tetratricopeptide (TPR) repeat protein
MPAAVAQRWLHGRFADLMLGCGVAYALLFGLMLTTGSAVQDAIPLHWAPLVALAVGAPHYGATLLRVYARAEDRRKYALFAWGATLLIVALFAVGAHVTIVGSLLLTLYLTWSPWHYSGQNYGIALMFLHRRGVPVTPRAKKLLHASFTLSFAVTFVYLHTAGAAVPDAPVDPTGAVYEVVELGIPRAIGDVLLWALVAGFVATGVSALALLSRGGRARELVPTALLVASQALWFVVPDVARWIGAGQHLFPLAADEGTYAFFWVAVAHSAQYLWITSFFAKKSASGGGTPYLARCLAAGAAVWAIPALLFAPGLLGRVPYDLGLGLLVASAVNIHHFVLDGVIWKLRDGRIAKVLLYSEAAATEGAATADRLAWLRAPAVKRAAVAVGVACIAVQAYATVESAAFAEASGRGDAPRMEAASARLAWLGRASARDRVELAVLADKEGDTDRAFALLDDSLRLYPTADAWMARGAHHARQREWRRAARAYERALAIDDDDPHALLGAALAWIRAGHPGRAEELRLRAVEAGPRARDVPDAIDDALRREMRTSRL